RMDRPYTTTSHPVDKCPDLEGRDKDPSFARATRRPQGRSKSRRSTRGIAANGGRASDEVCRSQRSSRRAPARSSPRLTPPIQICLATTRAKWKVRPQAKEAEPTDARGRE